MTQCEKIALVLDQLGEITQRDAIYMGIYRLASRINDLRRDGVDIRTEMVEVTNMDGSKSRIAVYHKA